MNWSKSFITTQYLETILEEEMLKVIDLREQERYIEGHIKGSIHVDNRIFVKHDLEGINILPEKEEISNVLQQKGINQNDKLVLVDDVFNLNCSLAAWTLHYFNFYDVYLLDGAFAKWMKEGRDLTKEQINYPTGNFQLTDENTSILITKDEILMNINSEEYIYVDNRSEYAISFDQQGGNIPGAIHYWYLDMFEEFPDYFVLKEYKDILEDLTSRGITRNKKIVVYCENAPQSALVYLVMKDLNYPNVMLYLAGYQEWRIICSFLG
ncbi:MAG: sulfurtransferase [Candidatus Heimdallarchaeaceae archaeon]